MLTTKCKPTTDNNLTNWHLQLTQPISNTDNNKLLIHIPPNYMIIGKNELDLAKQIQYHSQNINSPLYEYLQWLLTRWTIIDNPLSYTFIQLDDSCLEILAECSCINTSISQEYFTTLKNVQIELIRNNFIHDSIHPLFYYMAQSRALALTHDDVDDDDDDTSNEYWAFIPYADLLNHSFQPNSYYKCSLQHGFSLYPLTDSNTTTTITENQPLTIQYSSSKTNIELLTQYGFADGTNPNESIILPNHQQLFTNKDGLIPISLIHSTYNTTNNNNIIQEFIRDLNILFRKQLSILQQQQHITHHNNQFFQIVLKPFIEAKLQVVYSNLSVLLQVQQ
jgi:hypothetical protein